LLLKAAVLIVIVSRKRFEHNNKLSKTHSFDTGAAWQSLADDYDIESMAAIGRPAEKKAYPAICRIRRKLEPESL